MKKKSVVFFNDFFLNIKGFNLPSDLCTNQTINKRLNTKINADKVP